MNRYIQSIVGVVLVLVLGDACSATQAQKQAAEDAYGLQQLNCVTKFNTVAEIGACREGVRMQWGVDDAGVPTHMLDGGIE